jgi:hypothetical protein
LYPTTVDVLALHDRLTLCCGAGVPVPVTDSATEGLVALLENVMVPEATPLAWGVKVSVKDALWPALRMRGSDNPFTANSRLLVPTEEIVTLAPLAVRVTVWFWFAPTVTLPKFTVAGATANWPAAVAVAERETLTDGTEPVVVREIVPLALPGAWGANVTLKVRLCPAFRVVGKLRPLVLNPAPVRVAAETLILDPPELVIVSDRDRPLPTCTLPKLMLAGLTARVPAVTPVPERTMFSKVFEASLVMATPPVTLPAEFGAKAAVKAVLWPTAKVTGRLRPVTVKPVPLAEVRETVTVELLPLVSVMVCVWVLPTWTLPKLTLAGLAPSDPTARPDPASGTFSVATLLPNAIFPLKFPVVAGVKVAVNAALCPGESVRGRVKPLTLNPAPVVIACDTVTLVPAEFVMVPFWLCVLPTVTLPKLRLTGEAVKLPGPTPLVVVLEDPPRERPWQLAIAAMARDREMTVR